MKVFLVSLVTLFVCTIGRCDVGKHFHDDNQYKFAEGPDPNGGGDDDPLKEQWWKDKLINLYEADLDDKLNEKQKKKISAEKYAKVITNKNYFIGNPGIDPKEAPTKPITIIDDEIAKLNAAGQQYSLYRSMKKCEAINMGIKVGTYASYSPGELDMSKITGHIGHRVPVYEHTQQGDVVLEFKLLHDAHRLLFSPKVAAIGSKSQKTRLIAEVGKIEAGKGLGPEYAVTRAKGPGEGFVKDFIGIKSEGGDYYSIAMAANKGTAPKDTDTKKLLAKLTAEVIEKKIPA